MENNYYEICQEKIDQLKQYAVLLQDDFYAAKDIVKQTRPQSEHGRLNLLVEVRLHKNVNSFRIRWVTTNWYYKGRPKSGSKGNTVGHSAEIKKGRGHVYPLSNFSKIKPPPQKWEADWIQEKEPILGYVRESVADIMDMVKRMQWHEIRYQAKNAKVLREADKVGLEFPSEPNHDR